MGTYSFYLTSRNNADGCKIDWDAMNTDIIFKSYVLKSCYKKAATLEMVAQEFNYSKFIGYMEDSMIDALIEFNKHLIPYGCFPRIYYTYEGDDNLCCFEFIPGTDVINFMRYYYFNQTDAPVENELLMKLPEAAGWISHILTFGEYKD